MVAFGKHHAISARYCVILSSSFIRHKTRIKWCW